MTKTKGGKFLSQNTALWNSPTMFLAGGAEWAMMSCTGPGPRWPMLSQSLPRQAPASAPWPGITPRLPVTRLTVRTLPHSVVKLRHGPGSRVVLVPCQDSYCLLASYRNLPPCWPPVAQSKLLQRSLSSAQCLLSLGPQCGSIWLA